MSLAGTSDVSWNFSCDDEQSAFETYVTYKLSYEWSQISDWNETTLSKIELFELFGWNISDDSINLSKTNLINASGLSNSLISLEFDTSTLSEGDYYLFQLTVTVNESIRSIMSENGYVSVYVNPTPVIAKYDFVTLSEPEVVVENVFNESESYDTDDGFDYYYVYDLTNYFTFPVDNESEIENRYDIDVNCTNVGCEVFEVFDGILLVIDASSFSAGNTYEFEVTVIDSDFDLDAVSIPFSLKVILLFVVIYVFFCSSFFCFVLFCL